MSIEDSYKIFTNKKFWLSCLIAPLLLCIFIVVGKIFFNATNISYFDILKVYISGVLAIFIITLSLSLIIVTIRDLFVLRGKDRTLLIILLILFSLRALMGYIRSM